MDDQLVKISRRAVACKSWKWLPGMLGVRDTPPDKKDYLKPEVRIQGIRDVETATLYRSLPDLNDPATKGAILELVRMASRDDQVCVSFYDGHDSVEWGVISNVIGSLREEYDLSPRGWMRILIGDHKVEGAALVIALEEAESFYSKLKN